MGGTISNDEVQAMFVSTNAFNFIPMMRVSYGRDLNQITDQQWIDALKAFDRQNHPTRTT